MEYNRKDAAMDRVKHAINQPGLSLDKQLQLAKVLLLHYETFHPFLQLQMEKYTVACCNIALPGIVKFDYSSKTVIYEIYTEKKYKLNKGKLQPIQKSNVTTRKYMQQKKVAKMNLTDWTKKLLWGDATTVRIYIDGTEF